MGTYASHSVSGGPPSLEPGAARSPIQSAGIYSLRSQVLLYVLEIFYSILFYILTVGAKLPPCSSTSSLPSLLPSWTHDRHRTLMNRSVFVFSNRTILAHSWHELEIGKHIFFLHSRRCIGWIRSDRILNIV